MRLESVAGFDERLKTEGDRHGVHDVPEGDLAGAFVGGFDSDWDEVGGFEGDETIHDFWRRNSGGLENKVFKNRGRPARDE